jgi:hypothetical protein
MTVYAAVSERRRGRAQGAPLLERKVFEASFDSRSVAVGTVSAAIDPNNARRVAITSNAVKLAVVALA